MRLSHLLRSPTLVLSAPLLALGLTACASDPAAPPVERREIVAEPPTGSNLPRRDKNSTVNNVRQATPEEVRAIQERGLGVPAPRN